MELTDLVKSSGKYFKFDRPGDAVTGTVTDYEIRQQKDFDSGELKVWPDGNRAMEIVITLATDERDLTNPEDGGARTVYLPAYKAIAQALIDVCGAKGPQPGAQLTITYAGDAPRKPGDSPKKKQMKLYAFSYVNPLGAIAEAPAPAVASPPTGGVSADQAAMAKALAAGITADKITPDVIALFKSQL